MNHATRRLTRSIPALALTLFFPWATPCPAGFIDFLDGPDTATVTNQIAFDPISGGISGDLAISGIRGTDLHGPAFLPLADGDLTFAFGQPLAGNGPSGFGGYGYAAGGILTIYGTINGVHELLFSATFEKQTIFPPDRFTPDRYSNWLGILNDDFLADSVREVFGVVGQHTADTRMHVQFGLAPGFTPIIYSVDFGISQPVVPEPASAAMLGVGLVGVGVWWVRRGWRRAG